MKAPRKSVAEVYLSRWHEDSDTYKAMRSALDRVAQVLGGKNGLTFAWHNLRYEDVRGVPAKLAELLPSSINQALSALRGVLITAKEMGLIPPEEFNRIQVKNVKGRAEPAGRALDDLEKDAVFNILVLLPTQEAALVALLIGSGARRIEVVRVKRDDYDPNTGRVNLFGKGNKSRSVPVGQRWRYAIETWRMTLDKNEYMFPWDRRKVSYVISKLSTAIGGQPFTPHDLRRTFGTHVCKVADPTVAQRLMGHADIKTTLLYDRRGREAEDVAVKDL